MKQTRRKHMTFIGLPLVLLGILICLQAMALELSAGPAVAAQAGDGSVLPFPPVPSASVAAPRLQDSKHQRRAQPQHLKPGAPNVLIILLDDVGFAQASTFGGEIQTPTLSRLADEGISYNTFHTTSICSPTRAALLTGRNHQRVGNGTIAERAVDWDGYTGVIPKTSATMPEVLRNYGYKTAAFGKWHNTPADQTTAMGPFDRWPTGHGFDYFYGFLAGETSQWEPRLVENTNQIEPPHDEKYHLSEDLADRGIAWLRRHRAFSPDKPFFMYWAPGAAHGPHQICKAWADKYKGKFDDGWDAYRERVFARQKQLGWIPADTKLTPRAESMASWDSIPEAQRPFQRRLMEIYRRLRRARRRSGRQGDRRTRSAGHPRQHDRDLHLRRQRRQRRRPERHDQRTAGAERHPEHHRAAARGAGQDRRSGRAGLAQDRQHVPRRLGLGGQHAVPLHQARRLALRRHAQPDGRSRGRRASSPTRRRGRSSTTSTTSRRRSTRSSASSRRRSSTGSSRTRSTASASPTRSMTRRRRRASTCSTSTTTAAAPSTRTAGWRPPSARWCRGCPARPGLADWDSAKDKWELYNITKDFSQADNLAAKEPKRLAQLQKTFDEQAKANKVYPLGAGIWLRLHPEDRIKTPYTSWRFDATTTRMPEFTAPGLGRESNTVTIDAEVGENASGVLYALGGSGGGLTLYMDKGELVYEYNMMIIERYIARSANKLPAGKHRIEVTTTLASAKPLSPADVVVKVDGQEVARTTVKRTVPAAFSASETFDVGVDLGSPVSLDYFDRRPFAFTGKIEKVEVGLK